MPSITETVHITEDADALWRRIGSFGAVGDWHPMLVSVVSESEEVGALRTAETGDGGKQLERLLEIEPEQRFYRYAMEQNAMPVRDYVGAFRVRDEGDGTSTVTWSCEFAVEPGAGDDIVESISTFLRSGLGSLRTG